MVCRGAVELWQSRQRLRDPSADRACEVGSADATPRASASSAGHFDKLSTALDELDPRDSYRMLIGFTMSA
jgi:hypothetical protein